MNARIRTRSSRSDVRSGDRGAKNPSRAGSRVQVFSVERKAARVGSDSEIIRALIGRRSPARYRQAAGPAGLPGSWRLDQIARSLDGKSLLLFQYEWPGDMFQSEWNPKRSLKFEMSATSSGRAQFGVRSVVYTSYGSPVPGLNYGGHDLDLAIEICQKQFLTMETMGEASADTDTEQIGEQVRQIFSALHPA